MSSVLKCPSCHHPLSCAVETLGNRRVIYVYCGYGPCHPSWTNDGVPASTTEESYDALVKKFEEWEQQQKE